MPQILLQIALAALKLVGIKVKKGPDIKPLP
jgi:hypothetical protein